MKLNQFDTHHECRSSNPPPHRTYETIYKCIIRQNMRVKASRLDGIVRWIRSILIHLIIFILLMLSNIANANELSSKLDACYEVTIMLLDDFTWIQPQFKDVIINPNVPAKIKKDQVIKIRSKYPIINAYDALKEIKLDVSKIDDVYEVKVPIFTTISTVIIGVCEIRLETETQILPDWLVDNRVGAFVHLGRSIIGKNINNYNNMEAKLANMGFKHYVNSVKNTGKSSATLWNSHAVITKEGHVAYEKNEDLVREISYRAKKSDLHFIAYYKNTGDEEVLKSHPEWECKDLRGLQTHKYFIFIDFTTGYKEIVLNQLKELAERGVEAIYFDYIHQPVSGCFGSNLEKYFKEATGLVLPSKSSHKNYPKYIAFQAEALRGVFRYWKNELNKVYPDIIFIISTAYLSGLTLDSHSSLAEVSDVVKVEFESGRRPGIRGNIFKNTDSLAKPSDNILMTLALTLPRDLSIGKLSHVWTNRLPNAEHLKGFVSTAIALGGIAAIHIDNEYLKNKFYPSSYIDKQRLTPYNSFAPAINLGKKLSRTMEGKMPLQYAAVLFSDQLRNKYGVDYEKAWRNVIWPSVGAYQGFLRAGIPVNVISDNQLLSELSKYKVIFLPKLENELSLISQSAISKFKKNNGIIINNQPLKWLWDKPKYNEKAQANFLEYIKNEIKDVPFSVMLNNSSVHSFMYVKKVNN